MHTKNNWLRNFIFHPKWFWGGGDFQSSIAIARQPSDHQKGYGETKECCIHINNNHPVMSFILSCQRNTRKMFLTFKHTVLHNFKRSNISITYLQTFQTNTYTLTNAIEKKIYIVCTLKGAIALFHHRNLSGSWRKQFFGTRSENSYLSVSFSCDLAFCKINETGD